MHEEIILGSSTACGGIGTAMNLDELPHRKIAGVVVVFLLLLPFLYAGSYRLIGRPLLIHSGAVNCAAYQAPYGISDLYVRPANCDLVTTRHAEDQIGVTYYSRAGAKTSLHFQGGAISEEGAGELPIIPVYFVSLVVGCVSIGISGVRKLSRTGSFLRWERISEPSTRTEFLFKAYGIAIWLASFGGIVLSWILVGANAPH